MHEKDKDIALRNLALPLLGKWVPFILILLSEHERHFADLQRQMETVSRKVLSETLTSLEASGIVEKEGVPSTGFPVMYRLTELGKSTLYILDEIKVWLLNNEETLLENRNNYYKNK